jgi:hypothetical protein
MMSVNSSSWRESLVNASVPYAYAQHILKGPFQILYFNFYAYAEQTRKKLMHICSGCAAVPDAYAQQHINSWHVCSGYASFPEAHSHCIHKFLKHMLSVYKMNIWKMEKLMHLLSMLVRYWCVWSGCVSVPDVYAQHAN